MKLLKQIHIQNSIIKKDLSIIAPKSLKYKEIKKQLIH